MGRKLLPLEGRKILIVEDDYVVAADLGQMVVEAGGEVVGPAPSRQMALWLADSEDFDAALLDVRLADDDATEIAKTLTERRVPFIVITAYNREALPEELRGAPYMDKPVLYEELVAILSSRLATS